MLRVLVEARFLSAAPTSSIARYVRELVENWAELPGGPEITLFGPGPRPVGLPAGDRVIWRSPPAFASRLGQRVERGRLWLNTAFAASAVLERPDVMFFPWPFVPRVLRRPAVVTMHDLCYRAYPGHYPDRGQSLDARAGAALHVAHEIIAVSHACKAGVTATYGIDPNRITVVHHGVSAPFGSKPTSTDAQVCAQYGISAPFLLCVSTHQPRKNLELLIRAFAALVDRGAAARPELPSLVLVGQPSEYTGILRSIAARSARAEAALIMVDGLGDDDLAALYRRALAVVLPSLCEGFGFPLLEAVLSGTPVVASDLPVFHELVGDAAVYVPPTDVAAWTQAFADVLARECELQARTRAAAMRLQDRYTWRSASIRTLEVLERAAGGSGSSRKTASTAP